MKKLLKSIVGATAFLLLAAGFNTEVNAAASEIVEPDNEKVVITSDVDDDGCVIDEFVMQEYDASGMDILDNYFQGLLTEVPEEGWTAREAIAQIGKINEDVRMLLASLLNKDADKVSITDIAELSKITDISSFMEYISSVDTKTAKESFEAVYEDTSALLEEYFEISSEELAKMAEDGLTKEEVGDLLYSTNDEIHDLLLTYFVDSFESVINDELTQAEIASLLQEAGLGAVKLIEDVTGFDLSNVGVKDIHDALMSIDPVVTDYLSDITGIDIREAIDIYFDENTTVELVVDIEISPEMSEVLEMLDGDALAELIDPAAVEEMLKQGDNPDINPAVLKFILNSING